MGRVDPAASMPSLAPLPTGALLLGAGRPCSLPFTPHPPSGITRRFSSSPSRLGTMGVAIPPSCRDKESAGWGGWEADPPPPWGGGCCRSGTRAPPARGGQRLRPAPGQQLRAMAEAAATERTPRFFQRLPKVVRTGQARLLGCIREAEAALGVGSRSHDPGALFPAGGGSGVSREGEGTGGDPSRGSLAQWPSGESCGCECGNG